MARDGGDPFDEFAPQFRVERRRGLVENQHLARGAERPRKRHALRFAARERRGTPVEEFLEMQKRDGLLPGNERRSSAESLRKENVLAHAHRGKEPVVLEDEADSARLGRKAHALFSVVEHLVADRKASGVGRDEPRHEVGKRRFARTASPEHRREAARREASRQMKAGPPSKRFW